MDIQSLAALTDADLLAGVRKLAEDERGTTAALIAHLAEIEPRKLYLGEACSSLFTYCARILHLSEPAAYNRIQAARAARRFPAVLTELEQGRVHLAALRLLAPVLTMENHRELLAAAAYKSKREVEELVARRRPQPDVPGQVRKLPRVQKSVTPGGLFRSAEPPPAAAASTPPANGTATEFWPDSRPEAQSDPERAGASLPAARLNSLQTAARPRAVVVPLAPERFKVQFTVGTATREKLRRAQELLRHRIPSGDVGQVIDLALDLLVQDLERQKFAATSRPRRREHGAGGDTTRPGSASSVPATAAAAQAGVRPGSPSRYIPAAVRRAVWHRDEGQCAFVSATGARCDERGALEFDHIRPHADGGGVDLHNVRLLCRQHNQYEAQQFFRPWQSEPAHEPAAHSH